MRVIAAAAASVQLIDQPHEVAEEIKRIMRPRRRLRMVLDSDHRLAAMAKALQRLIVQINVSKFHIIFAERIGIDCEAVILRGDLYAAGLQMLHRMITAAMAEFQFVRASA